MQKRRLLRENECLRKTVAETSQFLRNIQMHTNMNKFLPPFSDKLPFPSLVSSLTPTFTGNESLFTAEGEIVHRPMPTLSNDGEYGMDYFGTCFDGQIMNNENTPFSGDSVEGSNDSSVGSCSSSPMSALLNNDFMVNGSDRDFNGSSFMNMMGSLPPIVNENSMRFGSVSVDDGFLESF